MRHFALPLACAALATAFAQDAVRAVITNLDTANWEVEKNAPPDTAGVTLHADAKTGALDLLVRFPAGHVIAPHYHDSNERIVVVEGTLILRQDSGETAIKTGGFAYLPAKDPQRLSCATGSRCSLYLSWDGDPRGRTPVQLSAR